MFFWADVFEWEKGFGQLIFNMLLFLLNHLAELSLSFWVVCSRPTAPVKLLVAPG